MTWSDFYLLCFVVGFLFSLFAFLAGGLHWHLPHLPHSGGGIAHASHAGAGHHAGPSPFNLATLAAFLAWFGGTGYLVSRFSSLWFVFGLGIAVASGVAGGAVIYLFLSRVLMASDGNMDATDYEMVGVLGRITMPIREGGTGELIYSQAGTRRSCGARADHTGAAIPKGSEVVVTRYEKGLAYVRLWKELAGEEPEEQERVES